MIYQYSIQTIWRKCESSKSSLNFFCFNSSVRYGECDDNCLEIIIEPEVKGTMILPRQVLATINNQYRSGFASLEMLEETIATTPAGLMFRVFSPLIEIFNEKSQQLFAGGFITHWYDRMFNPMGFTRKPEEIGPQVLTMEHLRICFLVCLCPLALSLIAFLLELLFSPRLSRMFYKYFV